METNGLVGVVLVARLDQDPTAIGIYDFDHFTDVILRGEVPIHPSRFYGGGDYAPNDGTPILASRWVGDSNQRLPASELPRIRREMIEQLRAELNPGCSYGPGQSQNSPSTVA